MTISILTTDASSIVRSWDPRLAEMTGLSGEAACGLHLRAIVPDFEKRGLAARFDRVLSEGVVETLAPALHHYLIPCPTSTPSKYFDKMQQRVTIAPLRDKEQIVGTIVTIEDVTQRLDRERELAEQLARPDASDADFARDLAEVEVGKNFAAAQLIQTLQDKNWQVRSRAMESLAKESDPEITAELLQLLRNEHHNASILNGVLQVLNLSQIDTIPALIECLKDPDPDLRIYAALALGERKDLRSVQPLLAVLRDPNQNVRYHAIDALGHLRSPDAVDALIEIAESNDFFLAFPALDALMRICDAQIAPRLLPLLKNTLNWRVRREAVDSIAKQNNSEIAVDLLRMLREQHRNPNVLNSVLQILVLSDVDPIPSLVECLKDPDPDVRIYTALALGERQDPRAISALIEKLEDEDANVRYHAIEALGRLRASDAVVPLVEIAESGDFFLGFAAIDALMRIEVSWIAPRLLPLVENDLLGTQAAEALGKLGDADVIPSMARFLNRPNLPIRDIAKSIAAIYERYDALFGEGIHIADLTRLEIDREGQHNLLDAIEEASTEELRALVLLLGWLEGEDIERALCALLDRPEVRESVLEAVVRYGNRVTPLLISQLNAVDLETRSCAAIALGRIGSAQAVPALIDLLSAEPELIVTTAVALAHIGDRSSFEALLQLLGHPDVAVRLSAIAALNSLGHPAMPDRIFTLMSDPNPWVRESAVKIAGYFAFDNCLDLLFERCEDEEERVRRAAIEHLPYLEAEDRALQVLQGAIYRETPQVRAAAARAWGEMDTPASFPYLLDACQDADPWVRYYAVCAIGKLVQRSENNPALIPAQSPFETLRQLAVFDSANPVRAAAAEALGQISEERAVPILASIVEAPDVDDDVVRAALRALGRIQHTDAIAPLLNALNSPNAERRLDALQAFKERGGTEAGVALQWLAAADPETRVVRAAIESLARMGTADAIASLLELTVDPTCRDACVSALASRGSSVELDALDNARVEAYIDAIARGLRHVHSAVRSAVVEILTRLKHPHASQLLLSATDDSNASVRLAAVTALGHLGNRECIDKLSILARSDPDTAVRRAAQKILQR